MWEYRGRDVHILGGTVEQAIEVYGYLADSVVSLDCNSHHNGATLFAKWWGKSDRTWNRLPAATPRKENPKRAYENSMINVSYALREAGVTY